ncbi:MAG: thiamine biosynthesis lipoprotein [Desulforhopalus sp.]|jgi:thiamine biosynthesis lipoprotein
MFFRRLVAIPIALFICVALSGCGPVENDIRGETMGTTYSIKIMTGRFDRPDHLSDLVDARLQEINASMSTYIADSEISTFNDSTEKLPFTPSADFLKVMRVAMDIHKRSGGAWDGSLDPLVTLWGFGRDGQKEQPPTQEEIEASLSLVDFNRVSISSDGKFLKDDPRLSIDLGSIAKGYGVDAIAALLKAEGYEDFLVEVGGEIFASGKRDKNNSWRVGINTPSRSAGFGQVYKVLSVEGKGLATSGDYRNFFVYEGRMYSHILDPRTGYPVTNGVVSASVIAKTCTLADGLATALMVMGPDSGIELVEQMADVEALIIVRNQDGDFEEYPSSKFTEYEL